MKISDLAGQAELAEARLREIVGGHPVSYDAVKTLTDGHKAEVEGHYSMLRRAGRIDLLENHAIPWIEGGLKKAVNRRWREYFGEAYEFVVDPTRSKSGQSTIERWDPDGDSSFRTWVFTNVEKQIRSTFSLSEERKRRNQGMAEVPASTLAQIGAPDLDGAWDSESFEADRNDTEHWEVPRIEPDHIEDLVSHAETLGTSRDQEMPGDVAASLEIYQGLSDSQQILVKPKANQESTNKPVTDEKAAEMLNCSKRTIEREKQSIRELLEESEIDVEFRPWCNTVATHIYRREAQESAAKLRPKPIPDRIRMPRPVSGPVENLASKPMAQRGTEPAWKAIFAELERAKRIGVGKDERMGEYLKLSESDVKKKFSSLPLKYSEIIELINSTITDQNLRWRSDTVRDQFPNSEQQFFKALSGRIDPKLSNKDWNSYFDFFNAWWSKLAMALPYSPPEADDIEPDSNAALGLLASFQAFEREHGNFTE